MGLVGRGAVVAAIGGCLVLVATFRGHETLEPLPVYWDQELEEMVRWNPAEVEVARRAERKRMVHLEARCSWRELNLVVEFPQISEYFDPEIMLGSILRDLQRDEGLDAYEDRMKIVVEDVDIGVYAAFDPWD